MTDDSSQDDELELELEPIDPDILDHARRLNERRAREADAAVDIEQIHRDTQHGDLLNLDEIKRFRFTIQHLLILTAVLTLVMTLCILLKSLVAGLFVSFMLALGAGWFYTMQRERRKDAEIERQRREVQARHAAMRAGEQTDEPRADQPVAVDINTAWEEANREARSEFKFAFSMKELFVAFTAAAVLMALVRLIGVDRMALVLGLVAVLGLVLHVTGFDPPPIVVFCWWLLMVFYLFVGLWAVTVGSDAAVRQPLAPTQMAQLAEPSPQFVFHTVSRGPLKLMTGATASSPQSCSARDLRHGSYWVGFMPI